MRNRALAVLAVFGVGLGADVALAAPKPLVVWRDRVKVAPAGRAALTSVSHKLYLNDCKPGGCTVLPGNDDSRTNRSSIPQTPVTLTPYGHGQQHWDQLVQCVRDTFSPFEVEIVTSDPGPSVPHFEVMIGGNSTQLYPGLEAGGVAPFVSCGAMDDNVISFVFPETTSDLEYLCGAVVQESCHVWGLDHELNRDDPMTYLDLGSLKRFQNDDADCGEALSSPRPCRCGDTTQNSYRYMGSTFGLAANLPPVRLVLATPNEGQWVRPGFPISGALESVLGQVRASLAIDGEEVTTIGRPPLAFNAPASLPPGPHAITVSATDNGERTVAETVNVHVFAACGAGASCAKGTHCLGGVCLPGGDVAGGLGAPCGENADCITGSCGDDGADSLCTAPCDGGAFCPAGYTCLSPSNVCWPEAGGGCATGEGGGGGAGLLLFGAGALALAVRRGRG
jgi:hypothetical protein